jgi:hypothetical protein
LIRKETIVSLGFFQGDAFEESFFDHTLNINAPNLLIE